jgi:hypothetical protein
MVAINLSRLSPNQTALSVEVNAINDWLSRACTLVHIRGEHIVSVGATAARAAIVDVRA